MFLEFLQVIAPAIFVAVLFIITTMMTCAIAFVVNLFRKEFREEIAECFWEKLYYVRETVGCLKEYVLEVFAE